MFRDDPPELDGTPDWMTTTGPLSPFTEARQISKVSPTSYNEARVIGETFRSGVPVIVSLSDVDDEVSRRVVDFCAGLTFGMRGKMERISPKVFLLSPAGVDVADEAREQLRVDTFLTR